MIYKEVRMLHDLYMQVIYTSLDVQTMYEVPKGY